MVTARAGLALARWLADARVVIGLLLLAPAACAPPDATLPRAESPPQRSFAWSLPPGFPQPPVPAHNPMTREKVELGQRLFYETRLSSSGLHSCASCHQQRLAFSDGRARAVGATGALHPRSAMSLANVAYNPSYGWSDPHLRTLEDQAQVPMFNLEPVELGVDRERALSILRSDRSYRAAFARAFPETTGPITIENTLRALAAFERTLLSGGSAYDRLLYFDDREGFPEPAQRGMRLFFSERLGCSECHQGFRFAGPAALGSGPAPDPEFHNIGLYNLGGTGSYPGESPGLVAVTSEVEDRGRFRAPTLRNIALTAPYMHDGSLPTLEAVIAHYAAGGRHIASGPLRGDGRSNPYKSDRIRGFALSELELVDLLAFLDALTDEGFLSDPRYADPRGESSGSRIR